MKKIILLSTLLLAFASAWAQQVPQKFSYQAVAVDAGGLELKNTKLCIRATILKTSFNGNEEWKEVFDDVTTDDFGLFTIEIGDGTPIGGSQGTFSSIGWGTDKHYLRIEMSIGQQCTNFVVVGTNQLISVPYALYSEKSSSAITANHATYSDTSLVAENATYATYATYADTSLVAENATYATYSDTSLVAENATYATYSDTTVIAQNAYNSYHSDTALFAMTTIYNINDDDPDPTNELQELILNGSTLTLTGAGSMPIDLNASDPDHDPTNELQNLLASGSLLSLSGSSAPPIDMNASDPDHDPTNELQNLSASGSMLSLSGSSAPPIDMNASDPDHDPTNEIQSLVLNGNLLSITGSNAAPINLNSPDADTDPTNEIQELVFDTVASTISITGGTTVINLASLPNFNASGSDLDFPQGITGAKYVFIPDGLTVPNDSVFYVIASEDQIIFPGVGNAFGLANTGPNLPIIKPGTVVDNCRCIGFFKEMDPFLTPVIFVLTANQGNFYQVPFNMNLVIKSGLDASSPITLDGFTISPFTSTFKALVIPSGIQVRNLGNDEIIITGYLVQSQ